MRTLVSRFMGLFQKTRLEQELDDEVRSHLEMLEQEYLRRGMSPQEARYAALRSFGGVDQTKERYREQRGLPFVDAFFQDLRYGWRGLLRNPGFAAVAILTLALGIGANTAIFSVVHAVLLRPLPYRNPSRLVYISEFWPHETPVRTVPNPDFANWSEHGQLFDGLAAYGGGAEVNLTGMGEPERLSGARVTADFFTLLGVEPFLGRSFLREEDRPGGRKAVLLSYELWQRRFGSNSKVIGSTIQLDGDLYTIVGVTPAGFRFPDDDFRAQVFLPMLVARVVDWKSRDPNQFRLLRALARLRPGVTPEQARAELTALVRAEAELEPPQFKRMRAGMEVRITPLSERLAAPARPILLILLSSVALLLIMSCVNVAGMQLARGATRQRELAVRAALGARRSRLAAQLLMENFVLLIAAAGVAVCLGFAGLRALRSLAPPQIPHLELASLDWTVLLFTLIAATITGILSGLAPAMVGSRVELNEILKGSGAQTGSAQRQHRVRSILVTTEIALALVLLIGSGLLTRSLVHLVSVDPGFNTHHLLTLRLTLSERAYPKPEQKDAFLSALLARLRALPGVRSAAAGSGLPTLGWGSLRGTDIEGQPEMPPGLRPDIPCDTVSTEYFQTLGIPLMAGRGFNQQDRASAAPAAIVNQAFAREFFSRQNPIGKHVGRRSPPGVWREIIGVVGNVRQLGPSQEESPEIYIPYQQEPNEDVNLVLRTATRPLALVAPVKAAVQAVDPAQPVYDIATMDQRLSESMAPQRFNALLLGVFALAALGLAGVGIFGVLAYSVARRTSEIGVRMALGASRAQVTRLVVGEGLRLCGLGVLLGLAGSVPLTRLLGGVLFGVGPSDPVALASASAALVLVAVLACYIPARRALSVDPMTTLRHE
ncbi:MAG: ABC transporter permease [Terriglobia bacterium]|jgi:putative ABC transport system permease protein